MKIPTSVFYQPFIPAELFNQIVELFPDQLEAQKLLLEILDIQVAQLICEHLSDEASRQYFIEQASLPNQQDTVLAYIQQEIPEGIDLLEERLERLLLELYTKLT